LPKCLYLIARREKWDYGEQIYNVDNILRTFTEETWWKGNLKEIYIGMNGLIKIGEDKNSDNFYEQKNCKKLKAGIYCTFKITEIVDDNTIKIKILDNFYKMGNIIDKEKLIQMIGEAYYTTQKPRYIDCTDYEKIRTFGIEINSYENTEELSKEESEKLIEGAKKQVTVNAYERSQKARQECIDKYGYKCEVCDFEFEKKYGKIGKNFIHVHHLKELNKIKKEYEVNPIKDLRPVCPNCHAMLHKRKPSYSIKELKSIIDKYDL
jgi:hypothetical protein